MHRRSVLVGAAALVACSKAPEQTGSAPPPAASASGAASDPIAVIRPLYARYMPGAPDFQYPNLEDQAPWSASLRQAMVDQEARFAAMKDGDPEGIDFDVFVNAQDWQLSNLNVTADSIVPQSHAVVRASFDNAGSHQEVVYDMVWENNGWRIERGVGEGPGCGRTLGAKGLFAVQSPVFMYSHTALDEDFECLTIQRC